MGEREGLVVGDARQLDALLPSGLLVDLTVTSPPYGSTIDYGVQGQIGFGQSPAEFRNDMAGLFQTLYARTADTGSLWLIVDTIKERTPSGIGRMVPLPFELAALAEQVGWILHDVVIWRKDRTLPWSRRGQLRNSFEYLLFFVKTASFQYHLDRIRTTEGLQDWWQRYPERYNPNGAAPTNVWDFPIPKQGSWSDNDIRHQCPLPSGLVRRIIELCSNAGDLVLDPFAGVGTVGAEAIGLGRRFFGVELGANNVEQFYTGVLPEALERYAINDDAARPNPKEFAQRIVNLRHAKLVRSVARSLADSDLRVTAVKAEATVQLPSDDRLTQVGSQTLTFYASPDARHAITSHVEGLVSKAPLSKYGISVRVVAADIGDWSPLPADAGWTEIHLDTRAPTVYRGNGHLPAEGGLVVINLPWHSLAVDLKSLSQD
jgi:DNA modification methylase